MASNHQGAVVRQIHRVFSAGTLAGMSEAQLLEHFLVGRDQTAFEVLVDRHGPMVWGVCRRLLHDTHDAEDAFQATFLVLFRRAASLRDPGKLSPWLHGVALRVASRARVNGLRRRDEERKVAKAEAVSPELPADAGLQRVIDEEIERLPEIYRTPVVLCHLEGRTYEDAAQALRWTTGMVRGRLVRARERLRRRLTARGVAPAGAVAAWLSSEAADAAVPRTLVVSTVEGARRYAAGGSLAGSGTIAALADGAVRTLLVSRLKLAAGSLVALGALSLVAWAGAFAQAGKETSTPKTSPPKAPQVAVDQPADAKAGQRGRTLEFRVVDRATGNAMAGVPLIVGIDRGRSDAKTDESGRFVIREIPPTMKSGLTVWAKMDGFVPKEVTWWNDAANSKLPETFTLQMERATTIGGEIRNEEGAPIAKATVFVRADGGQGDGVPVNDVFDYPCETDAQGRWKCDVVPADAHVGTRLAHPDYVSDENYHSTPEPPPERLRDRTAVMVLKRGATLTGTVRDVSGRPIPNASVKLGTDRFGSPQPPSTVTDGQGRYRFQVLPGSHVLTVQVFGYAPELRHLASVQAREQVDFRLEPPRTLAGRVVDPQGRPVAGAYIGADTWRGYRTLEARVQSSADGRFRWEGAPADEVLMNILKSGCMAIHHRPLTASAKEITITLSPLLRVHGSVVDAETGRPVEAFTVVPGVLIGDSKPFWNYREARSEKDGRYQITFDDPRTPHVRIEAKGYKPATSRPFQNDEGDQVFDFKLQKSATIAGAVRLPDGTPLAGADVILVTRGLEPTINNGRITQRDRNPLVATGPDGRFELPAQEEDFSIAVFHDRGFAERSAKQLAQDPLITVQPWGRIVGTFRTGARPAPRTPVGADRRDQAIGMSVYLYYLHSATTDDLGRFTFDRVPPGEFYVAPVLQEPRGLSTSMGNGVTINVRPGETERVKLGETGRPVVGKIVLPKGARSAVDWSYGQYSIRSERTRPTAPRGLSPDDERRWWRESAEAKAYRESARGYPFIVGADGSFRVEGVPAGPYRVGIQVYDPPSGTLTFSSHVLGQTSHSFVVPDLPGGRSLEPLDLGSIELTVNK